MAKVIFVDEGTSVEVPDGTRLQDAIDQVGADIPFGCREGDCATCLIQVVDGVENLGAPNENEEVTLMDDELAAGLRLACQCRVHGGTVSIRPSEDA